MRQAGATRAAFTLEADLDDVCAFLHENLRRRFSSRAWRDSLTQNWSAVRPNYGAHLRHEGRVVGALCAIYSDQTIAGRTEAFCNPHSWVVLEGHRAHSNSLLMLILRQRGYHFTMFTPNPKVAQVFAGLRFRTMDDRLLHLPNLPRPAPGCVVETDVDRIAALLEGAARADFLAHSHLGWLRFAAFGSPGRMAWVVYKAQRWKKLRCAVLSHVSDAEVMRTYGHGLRSHLLLRQGFAFTRVEQRWLGAGDAPLAIRSRRQMPKMLLSGTLADAQVSDLYSELMALDL